MRAGPGNVDGVTAIRAVADGDITPAELYEDSQSRIAAWEPGLGAVVEHIDYRTPLGGSIAGMTLGVKSHIDVAGHRNWQGLQTHGTDARPVAADATVVARLRAHGGTLVCTTAAPFMGAPGGVTPQTSNPRSPDRISGGSSGGSAAAVAAGLVHAALGNDSGGSIRIPAACCGVVGLQTTRGLVPLTGTGGHTFSIGNVGPMAATVGDVRAVVEVIAGFDERDPYSVAAGKAERWDGRPLRIGLPTELVDWNIDEEVAEAFDTVADLLRSAGHRLEGISVPMLAESMELGPRTIGIAESGALLEAELAEAMGSVPGLAGAIEQSKTISGPELARAYHRVAMLRSELRRVFAGYDMLLTPTLPCRVPDGSDAHLEATIEVGGATETRTSALTRLVNPWNLAAVPAGSQPVARDPGGAPISVQVIGPPFSDWRVLDVMELIETSTGGPWDTVGPPT